MKVGIDCHHLKDQKGIERYLLNLLNFWKDKKEVNFILYFEKKDKSFQNILQSKNFSIKRLKNPFNISSTALFQHITLPKAAKEDKVDILFSPSYLLPIFYQGRTGVAIHDIIYETHPEWFNFRGVQDKVLIKWAGRESAKKADIIFTPSKFAKQEINKSYEVGLHKIVVTPLAADKIFQQKEKNNQKNKRKIEEVKRKYRVKKNYFLFAAAIFKRRSIRQSILAFEKIAKKYLDFQYLIIGKDFSGENINTLVRNINKKLKREAVIYYPDFVGSKDLLWLYNGAYAFIYLSDYEGFGLPVLEAQACGTPVITTDKSSLKEITRIKTPNPRLQMTNKSQILSDKFKIIDSRNTLLAGSHKPKNIATVMQKIIDDKELYNELVKKGLENVKRYSWRKCAQKTLKAIIKITKDR